MKNTNLDDGHYRGRVGSICGWLKAEGRATIAVVHGGKAWVGTDFGWFKAKDGVALCPSSSSSITEK